MRLRTYESFFLIKNGLLSTYPSLQKNLSTDIVVLGGGITGALISHALFNAGYETVVLDKRDIGLGSTSATTSMLQYEIDVPLYKLALLIGEEEAVTCYKASQESIRILEKFTKPFPHSVSNFHVDILFSNTKLRGFEKLFAPIQHQSNSRGIDRTRHRIDQSAKPLRQSSSNRHIEDSFRHFRHPL